MAEGMRLKATHNLDAVFAKMDAYSDAVQAVAMPIALNKLGDQARVVGQRAIRKEYGITIDQLGKYMDVIPATGQGALEFIIVAVGLGFPMSFFKPRPVPGKGGGVRVTVKGRTFLIKHAFMHNGQVFARGKYGSSSSSGGGTSNESGQRRRRKRPLNFGDRHGRDSIFQPTGERFGRFAYGRNRFPITMLRSTTPPAALMNPDVVDAMNERIQEQAPSVIRNAIKFATSGR